MKKQKEFIVWLRQQTWYQGSPAFHCALRYAFRKDMPRNGTLEDYLRRIELEDTALLLEVWQQWQVRCR